MVNDYTMRSPSSSYSFDSYLNFSSPVHKYQSKKRKRIEFEEEEVESSQEIISEMTKRIKLLEDEIKRMLETQQKMKIEMESLINKNVIMELHLFAPLSKEIYEKMFKGLGDVKFSEKKSQEAWRKEG